MAKKGKPENLKPFKPGDDPRRNLAGPPRKLPALDRLLADILGYEEGNPEESARAAAILEALYNKAIRGDTRAADIILERAYGKAKQSIDLTTKGEALNKHVVEFKDYTKKK